nr:hypothetical protein BACY1_08560 [Tenacibaculum mesophilum]
MKKLSIYKHITGVKGCLIKEYKPTGKPVTIQIKLLDDRIYFAPKNEFTKL